MAEIVQLYKDKEKTKPIEPKITGNNILFNDKTMPEILANLQNNFDENLKCDILWGGGVTWSTGNITLKYPFTNYDFLIFVYSQSGEQLVPNAGYTFSTSYPVGILYGMLQHTSHFATFGYSTRYCRYKVTSTTTFVADGQGSDTTGMIAVYGIKVTKNIIKSHYISDDKNTLFLLRGDELNDQSKYSHAVKNNGTVFVSEASTPTNIGYAINFNGNSCLDITDSIIPLTGDCTIEFWLYRATSGGAGAPFHYWDGYSGDDQGILLGHSSGANIFINMDNSTARWSVISAGNTTTALNRWEHWAFVRYGDTIKFYMNGTEVLSTTVASSYSFRQNSGFLNRIGAYYNGSGTNYYYGTGLMCNFRISDIARYTSNFTPSTQSY